MSQNKPGNQSKQSDQGDTSVASNSDWRIYRRLLAYVLRFKFPMFLALLGFALYAAAAPLLADLMKHIARAVENPTEEARNFVALAVIGVFVFRGIGTFLGTYFIAVVGRGIVHEMRLELFKKLFVLPTQFYDQNSSGRMISRFTFDVEQVTGAATRAIKDLVSEGLTVIALLSYMFYINWQLTLVFLIAAPVIGVIVSVASRYFRKYSRKVQSSVGEVTQIAGETIGGYKEVKIFESQDYEFDRFNKVSENNRKQSVKYQKTNAISVPVIQFLVAVSLAGLVWIGLGPTFHQGMDSGVFFAYITAASTIAKPLRTLSNINSVIQKGIAGAESVFEMLDAHQENDSGKKFLENCKGKIEFQDVNFKYPEAEEYTLKNIDFSVSAGETIAFVGPSGSGKSTLVNLLPRFHEINSGRILVDGQKVDEVSLMSLREQIAIVSQQVTLFNDTVFNNIAYGGLQSCSKEKVFAAAKAAHAHEFICEMDNGYETIVGDDGVLLSGGQRQRIAIARAILKDAPILVMDEATSALDTEAERLIQDALEKVMENRTTFVIAHRLSTIEKADRIMVVVKGEIVESGSHEELLAAGNVYSNLHQMQFKDEA